MQYTLVGLRKQFEAHTAANSVHCLAASLQTYIEHFCFPGRRSLIGWSWSTAAIMYHTTAFVRRFTNLCGRTSPYSRHKPHIYICIFLQRFFLVMGAGVLRCLRRPRRPRGRGLRGRPARQERRRRRESAGKRR
jgi:hypothetical protein